MSLYEQFQLDEKKLADGAEVTYGANSDRSIPTFILARMAPSNIKYAKAFEAAVRPYRRQIELETMDEMVARDLGMKVFCQTILLGWENIQDEKGQTLSFNYENAMALLRKLPELYDDLAAQAKKASLFREEMAEVAAKN